MTITPMFPLGSVLVPGMVIALNIFEARYRALMEHCVASQDEFGVVLIARGSEVGGGESRYDFGCLANVERAVRFDDGRWQVMCRGSNRIQVIHWLADDPYPRANLDLVTEKVPGTQDVDQLVALVALLRTTLAMASEVGLHVVPATIELPTDPVAALWKACEVAPLGDHDRMEVLRTCGFGDRLELLSGLIVDLKEQLILELHQPRD